MEWDEDGRVCHIRDVIGPDEYKQRVTDNTYTNYMARHNLRLAVQIAERLEKEDPEYLGRRYLTHFTYLVDGLKDYKDELSKKHSDIDQKICAHIR